MSNVMPQRPEAHRNESMSRRVFGSAIPSTWVFRDMGDDYGIDGHVEMFDGDSASGLIFNVQLKSTERHDYNKVRIATSTRNYWKELDLPTLVVLVDASETVHYGWAHQWDLYGRRQNAATYTFELPSEWDADSAESIEHEVRATRAARRLRDNLPIYWSIDVDPAVSTQWAAAFQATLERGLAGSGELTRRADQAGWARLQISLAADVISVRLHGTPGGFIHYAPLTVDSFAPDGIAADVMLSAGVEIERGGLDVLTLALIETAIPSSLLLGNEEAPTLFAINRVTAGGRSDLACAMIERLYLDPDMAVGELVPIAIAANPGRLTPERLSRIAERIAEGAESDGTARGALMMYNAGNMIRHFNPARGLDYYDRAAEMLPEYRQRGYWQRERTEILFDERDFESAIEGYERAIELGEESAVPLLADAEAYAGRYADAVETWRRMHNVTDYLWLLKLHALESLVDELSIETQTRQVEAAEAFMDQPNVNGIDALQLDVLNISALWRTAAQRRESEQGGWFTFYLAAAAFAARNPMLWFEAFLAAQDEIADSDQLVDMQTLIVLAAQQEGGDLLRQHVLEDEWVTANIPQEQRDALLRFLDAARPLEAQSFTLRGNGVELI